MAGCENEVLKPEPADTDYYPLQVGSYRVYRVEVKNYSNNVVTTSTLQRRERVVDTYTNVSGALTYRLIRSVRPNATAAWQDDSVMTLTVKPTTVELSSNNRRTVELVFPAKNDVQWNRDVYNDRDTVIAKTRQYQAVGAAYTIGGQSYNRTITTVDPSPDTIFYRRSQRQIFAQGVGPVYREKRVLNYCQGTPGQNCQIGSGYVVIGEERRETLIEYKP
ncbi:hypothetical protein GCM10023186_30960 [Hymenobacter koreensis]|uniref:DUF4249 domain-containing protein n=1 Tax=Hymenobacter koreensis TaxID=1084523 RepID=A0ABP8J7F3_9BACT